MAEPEAGSGAAGPGRRRRGAFALLVLLVALQTVPGLWSRDFAAGDEVRHADALRHLQDEGHWAVLRMNGKPYLDKPPVYFWLAHGLSTAFGTREASVWFLLAALSGIALLAATRTLARRTGAGESAALVAGLLLLATPLFVLLTRTTRSDALFSALIVLAQAWLFRGLSQPRSSPWTIAGLLVASVATLVKGPLGLAFPAVGAVVWLLVERRPARLLRPDVLLGVVAAALPVAAWLIAIRAAEGPGLLTILWEQQVLGRAFGASAPHAHPFWYYAWVLPLVFLPWTLLLLAAPWKDGPALAPPTTDHTRPGGARFLATQVLSGVVLLSLFRSKFENYLLPMIPAAAVLTAAWLERAPLERLRRGWVAVGAAGVLLALPLAFGHDLLPPELRVVGGLTPVAVAFAATGVAVFLSRDRPGPRPARVAAVGVSVAVAIASLLVQPTLDPVLSPRDQTRALARRMDDGSRALAYRVYPGTYSWHAARTIRETDDLQEVVRFLATPGPVVVATPAKYRDRNPEVFAGMDVAHEQWFDGRTHLLLVRNGPGR